MGAAQDAERRRAAQRHANEAQSSHAILAAQDTEYQISLVHDQLKSLELERQQLSTQLAEMRSKLEECEQQKRRAQDRLARYGENPRLHTEIDEANETIESLQSAMMELEQQISIT